MTPSRQKRSEGRDGSPSRPPPAPIIGTPLDTFFAKFDELIGNPDSVSPIRSIIYSSAVSGLLSESHPGDAPVADLLRDLDAGKAMRFGRRKSIRNDRSDTHGMESLPISTPPHWAWVSLGRIGSLSGGLTPSKNKSVFWDGDLNWFSSKDIKTDEIADSELKITRAAADETGLQLYRPGCLVMVARSGILKRTFPVSILRAEGTVNQDLKVLYPYVDGLERYLQIMFRGMMDFILTRLVKTGMTVQSLKFEEFEAQPFPLPPLAEQKRIVAKVDELMALCDRLEAQLKSRDEQHATLARAALARFAEAPTPANLEILFHDHIAISPADLRKSILTLAVQGQLVPQNSNDDPPSKSFPGLTPIDPNESESAETLPPQWELCTYRSLTSLVTSGSRGWKEFYAQSGSIFVRTQNIKTDRLILDDVAYVQVPAKNDGTRARVQVDDILITITGANVTKAARVDLEIPEAYVSQHIALTRPRWPTMSSWLHLCFISHGSARGVLELLAYGDKPGLNLENIRSLRIPIPPLPEQHRIVAKVDHLMALVDKLETRLSASRTTAGNLLVALIAELTSRRTPQAK